MNKSCENVLRPIFKIENTSKMSNSHVSNSMERTSKKEKSDNEQLQNKPWKKCLLESSEYQLNEVVSEQTRTHLDAVNHYLSNNKGQTSLNHMGV